MLKREELSNPSSCMSRARDDEMTFVLLGRDPAASVAIRAWIEERIRLGKNAPDDAQILEAQDCAEQMEHRRTPLEQVLGMAEANQKRTEDHRQSMLERHGLRLSRE